MPRDGLDGVETILYRPTTTGTEAYRRVALLSPVLAGNEELKDLAPATIIACEEDVLLPQAVQYAWRLEQVGVPVQFKQYPEAKHGFIEVNHPEYAAVKNIVKSPMQEKIAKECNEYIIQELTRYFSDKELEINNVN